MKSVIAFDVGKILEGRADCGRLDAKSSAQLPTINRPRRLPVAETKNSTCVGWYLFDTVLGGPGRNRSTDTRIIKHGFRRDDFIIAPSFAEIYVEDRQKTIQRPTAPRARVRETVPKMLFRQMRIATLAD